MLPCLLHVKQHSVYKIQFVVACIFQQSLDFPNQYFPFFFCCHLCSPFHFSSFACLDTIYGLLSDLDISTIAYIRPFLLCTNVKHPFCAICAAEYIGNVHNSQLPLLSNQPKLLKFIECKGNQWYYCKYPQVKNNDKGEEII